MSARVLVVDDIEANRRLLQAKLEAQYFDVTLVDSGAAALVSVEEETPDIILLDVMMPGMDGYEVCRRLKSKAATKHIPIVMVTALSDAEDRIKGLDVGAEDFLTKPVDDFALMSRINALLRYNAVAFELRQRQATGLRAGAVEEINDDELDRPARIFVIDDNPRVSARVASILREGGHTATTLLEAGTVKDLAEKGVDILMLSLNARAYDPLKLVAHFKMNETTRAMSIILTCDTDDKVLAGKGLELGASDVIFAPIDRQELLARIRTQARRYRYIEILRDRVDRGLELSVVDQLTGLYNRRYMTSQLRQLMKRSVLGHETLSVVMVDIDHFKDVNDTYGHEAGDDVLRELADRLRENVRPMDIVCRSGGEEFLIVMPDTSGDLACAAAERIRRAVAAETFTIERNKEPLDVTLSAGVATTSGGNDTIADVLKRADTALYQAKTAGRNRVGSVAA